jgi:rhodanese-related sulfurtransferase
MKPVTPMPSLTAGPRVLAFPAPTPQASAAKFAADLEFEVDPDDLMQDLAAGDQRGYVVVETRSPEAFEAAHIPGTINLPYRDMTAESTADLDRDLVYVCYCESFQCNAATKGALKLAQLGFTVKRLAGGIAAWRAAGFPVETSGVPVAESGSPIRCAC